MHPYAVGRAFVQTSQEFKRVHGFQIPFDDASFVMPDADAFKLGEGVTFNARGKRILELSVIGLLLLPAAFVIAVVAILVKCDSKRSRFFFCQKRLGKDGKSFNILKFRTMYHEVCDDTSVSSNSQEVPRITRIGHYYAAVAWMNCLNCCMCYEEKCL